MPQAFTDCVKNGGRIRTRKLSGGKYIKICFPKGGGSSVAGEVHEPRVPNQKTR